MEKTELLLFPIDRDLSRYIGTRTNGGCNDCAAFFDVHADHCPDRPVCAHIFHDVTCPFFQGVTRGETQPK